MKMQVWAACALGFIRGPPQPAQSLTPTLLICVVIGRLGNFSNMLLLLLHVLSESTSQPSIHDQHSTGGLTPVRSMEPVPLSAPAH